MTTSAILSLNPPLTAASLIGLSRDEIINQSTLLITSLTTPPPSAWSKSSTTYNTSSFPTVARSSSSKPNRKVPGTGMTDRYKWHSRTSEHKPVTGQTVAQLYDAFRSGLLLEHSRHEQEYIQSCSKAELLQVVPPGVLEVWRMSYHLPFPTTDREFVILILTTDTTPAPTEQTPHPPRSFQIVSIPFDHIDAPPRRQPRRHKFVRGKYVSVEEVREDGDKLVWRMSTSSDPGGLVPRWISELAMPSKISEDVPSFVKWLKKREIM